MSAGEGPGAGGILIGIFLILCGLCFALVGGGCSIFWIAAMFNSEGWFAGSYGGGILMLLVCLAIFAAGAVVLWAGGKIMLGKM